MEMETSVAEHYAALTQRMENFGGDLLACHFGLWGSDTKTDREGLQRANETLVQGCELGPDRHVLDAGCGVGGTAIALATVQAAACASLSAPWREALAELLTAACRSRALPAPANAPRA